MLSLTWAAKLRTGPCPHHRFQYPDRHSVVAIEHDLDLIAEADWIIDLGPEGGDAGGQLVAASTPEDVVRARTHTGQALGPVLARGN